MSQFGNRANDGYLWIWGALAVLATLAFLAIAGWILAQAVGLVATTVSAAADVAVAIIAAAAAFIAALLTHTFELERQRAQDRFLAKQAIDDREYQAKRKNYAELLNRIGEYIQKGNNEIVASHLGTWAFGDLSVVRKTNDFIGAYEFLQDQETRRNLLDEDFDNLEQDTIENLKSLLQAIRLDLQQYVDDEDKTDLDEVVGNFKVSVLFPEEKRDRYGFRDGL